MLTPQEVASRSFSKAAFGGYNMPMVDEFLDLLTEDYTALYNDNAILKNKLKTLADKVEEYRATDDAMRKTLLAAKQMADAMVSDAEKKKLQMERDAEAAAAQRMAELQKLIDAEEYRLKQAREATAAYARQLRALHDEEMEFLSRLDQLAPPETPDNPAADIQSAVSALTGSQEEPAPAPVEEPEEEEPVAAAFAPVQEPDLSDAPELDPDTTRRFEDLQFGRDYEIQ